MWKLDLPTGIALALTRPGTLRPAVSPDGKRLAWTVYRPPGIVVAELDGRGGMGPEHPVTDQPGDTGAQFTHDGADLIFVRLDPQGGERVWTVPVAEGAPRPLSPPQSSVASASPVTDEVVYLRARDDLVELVAIPLHGDRETVVATLPKGSYRGLHHSPDGKRLLVVREELEILEIDRATREARSLWRGGVQAVTNVGYAADGESVLAGLVTWEGDLWIVDGKF